MSVYNHWKGAQTAVKFSFFFFPCFFFFFFSSFPPFYSPYNEEHKKVFFFPPPRSERMEDFFFFFFFFFVSPPPPPPPPPLKQRPVSEIKMVGGRIKKEKNKIKYSFRSLNIPPAILCLRRGHSSAKRVNSFFLDTL
eukprot:TRINITY_DN26877_c0_g1_i1.p1 TRINITY_DN26877_c0_g1~~TRINITY_DN26877_c0_g1_i1.p1  ORF type:complete len:137 (+),score=5.59 TRINITY_DN26877_c0_g1_i1:250-660(+)